MRLLYIDVDSLRADHLGCYGYHRDTSPNIDRIANEGVRFTNCYASDAPCLPSRSALFSGCFGIHTGVVNHGGVAAQPFIEGPDRGFRDWFGRNAWPVQFRKLGWDTVAISTFGERHSAWHWHAGFNEIYNNGRGGNEDADQVADTAIDWLERKGKKDNWFMHLNLWDPHTAYRVPSEFGNPFEGEPYPEWLTEEVRQQHWQGSGPHSAREAMGYSDEKPAYLQGRDLPRQPWKIDSMDAVRKMFDGYDTGVRYADEQIGRIFQTLEKLDIADDTAVILSCDHSENLGELNIYGDHQTADHCTCRLPLIIRWPGITDKAAGSVDDAMHYHVDFAATAVELAGGEQPAGWDGQSFAAALRSGESRGRERIICSQAAWCVQRAVRWDHFMYIRTFHDAWHNFPDEMLFDIEADPHEQNNLAAVRPDLIQEGRKQLDAWKASMMKTSAHPDPLETVLAEGGSLHSREGGLPYLRRLQQTGRAELAEQLAKKHHIDLKGNSAS
jgi:choline-sulfatase